MITSHFINELISREEKGNPIRVAVAGTGFIGRGLLNEISLMKGIKVIAVANRNVEKASDVLNHSVIQSEWRICSSESELNKAIEDGKIGIVSNPLQLAATNADIIVDCIGDTEIGALLALESINSGKSFIANPEMDATVGPVIKKIADDKGVVYSGYAGDEPGVLMGVYNFVTLIGLDIVAAGKFKSYYNKYSTPETAKPWADKLKQSPVKISSFADGTKMHIEMTEVANATGLVPEVRGMHCPQGKLEEVASILKPKELGGILSSKGIIEVVSGAEPSGGVFVVATTTHPQIKEDLKTFKMGDGPNYLFYRPYHLASVELAVSIVRAILDSEAMIAPIGAPIADVITVAKKDLYPGDTLDYIGGFTFYGLIDRADIVKKEELLPVGLAPGLRVIKEVKKDSPISIDDVEINKDNILWELRKKYNDMII